MVIHAKKSTAGEKVYISWQAKNGSDFQSYFDTPSDTNGLPWSNLFFQID
jgi:hypothetical protein